MNKKSGTAGTAVTPTAPKAAHEADVADPGQVSETKAKEIQTKSGKYGSTPSKPFTSQAGTNGEQTETTWVEIELVGEDDSPISGERYRITLPDGSTSEGTLDHRGWARVAGFKPGQCQITFPVLDGEAWEFIASVEARTEP